MMSSLYIRIDPSLGMIEALQENLPHRSEENMSSLVVQTLNILLDFRQFNRNHEVILQCFCAETIYQCRAERC